MHRYSMHDIGTPSGDTGKPLQPGVRSISKAFPSPNTPFAGSHIFNTGPIDGYEQECPVQLRVHLSPPRKRSQARSVCELCVCRDCCGSEVWNPQHLHVSFLGISTSLPLAPAPTSHLHLKCSCWGLPEGSQMDRTGPCLAPLP